MTAQHASPVESILVDETFEGQVHTFEPMTRHTTYHIGGPARFYVNVDTLGALNHLIDACTLSGMPWVIVGRGSNLLVSDAGYPGVVIRLGRDFRKLQVDEERRRFTVGAGVLLSAAVQEAFKRSLAGLEFAVGTPGTIGGALRMNAGSRNEWISSRVVAVTSLVPGKGLQRKLGEDIQWGYRTSSFGVDEILLECELAMEAADPFFIRDKMERLLKKRKENQPLNVPSCGSVFKNPEGASAGALIDALGLKGYSVGGAQISETHANFIVNTGNASANDVLALMRFIQAKVREAYGIELLPEVQFLGFE